MKHSHLFYLFIFLLFFNQSFGQTILPLWPDQIPNQNKTNEKEIKKNGDILSVFNVQTPTLEFFLPTKKTATGKAVIICPGGGYSFLAYDWEGTDIAKWFNAQGIAAFVLKYRLPISSSLIKPDIAPLQDAQRAIRLVRKNAKRWNIDPNQIGVMGFSAGGHLASTLGTHFNDDLLGKSNDTINSLSARPDFMILIYPVISFNELNTHKGSKINLIGENAPQSVVDHYSNELQVNEKTPPTFLLHSTDDAVVPVANSLLFYQALEKKGIDVEMHIYPKGGHGYGLGIGLGHLQQWPSLLNNWLNQIK